MIKSVETWKRLIFKKGDVNIAEAVLGDLVGYRKTSLKRSDDVDTLVNFIAAVRAIEKEQQSC